ncbi:DNA-binding protein [Arthrobacter sp. Soil782]|uniref:zinc ribbon domain-containing protein n=1 Tax=Arthrobacter sp. Soil782 TaxID=1736410 RepID=UPI0006F461F7|nr:C4-type zinc ribbon domain-containing protein [Arthrobacter sp. Soil782]KRF07269.1 DNA-binding protein [Arthrobacter sp. Soil782]
MAKAPQAEQLRLLDLQASDSKLNQLQRQAATVSANPELVALAAQVADAESALVSAATNLGDAERDLTRAEDDVQAVVTRLERDEQRLNSGSGTSKDLTALQSEVTSLIRRRSDLEDIELEVMERVEAARAARDDARKRSETVRSQLGELERARDEELGRIDAERAEVQATRDELAASFEPALLAIYERTLAKRGVGAARLFHGRSEGSGMELSPGDLADISRAAADDVVFCPDSGCILVRSSEWGS